MVSNGQKFPEYLKSRKVAKSSGDSDSKYTHTRIGDNDTKIYGGTYNVPDNESKSFLEKYYRHVFVDGNKEYLTEKQIIENGPLLIDIDLRYENSVTTKQHTQDHIIDLINIYAEKCGELLNIPDNTVIKVYVMEKKDVNQLKDKTKDGIHIIIGIGMHKAGQLLVREKVLEDIRNIWDDIPIQNTWEDVLDEGVTKGFVNWQLYGSRKPNHQAYMIKYYYDLTYNNGYWEPEQKNLSKFDTHANIHELSARNTSHPTFEIRDEYKQSFEEAKSCLGKKRAPTPKAKPIRNKPSFDNIDSLETLDALIEEWFEDIDPVDYVQKETHEYTMGLPASFYGPGSYNNWIRVGWALKNTNKKMFLTWLKFSSQDNCRDTLKGKNGKFDWSNVAELFEMWCGFDFDNPDGLSYRSIMFWCKVHASENYWKIRTQTIDFYIDETVKSQTEFALATVLFNLFKDKYVCVSYKNNCWYEYSNYRWHEVDSGITLRLRISREMHAEYVTRVHNSSNCLHALDQTDEAYEPTRKRVSILGDLCVMLNKTQWKNNIMKEAKELFFDKDFISKLDQNPYLLCCKNYVIDFKQKTI